MPDTSPASGPPATKEIITPWMIYLLYTKITLLGFGGTMFWLRRSMIEDRKWVTEAEFVEMFTVAQLVPGGANLYNLSLMLGHRFAGVRGAVAAGLGFISVPFFVMVTVALLYLEYGEQPLVNKALTGMFTVVVGLMIANAYSMAKAVPRRLRPWLFTLLTFTAIGAARWPLVSVMLLLAPFAVSVAWRDIAGERVAAAKAASATAGEAK